MLLRCSAYCHSQTGSDFTCDLPKTAATRRSFEEIATWLSADIAALLKFCCHPIDSLSCHSGIYRQGEDPVLDSLRDRKITSAVSEMTICFLKVQRDRVVQSRLYAC